MPAPNGTLRDAVRRDIRSAPWWTRLFARRLLAREARALKALAEAPGVPRFLARSSHVLVRTWIDGLPMQQARPTSPDYFRSARRLLVGLHRVGVTHNDTAKEPNWLVDESGAPALVDFQLARITPRRGRLFRLMAREDLRHLLKHKRTYCAHRLSLRERAILARPTLASRLLRGLGKPIYNFITRRLLRWQDREGRNE